MKTLVVLFSLLYAATPGVYQEPLSRAEALGKIYEQYNDVSKTAQWVCAKDRQKDDPCWVGDDATVSITLLLAAEITEEGIKKTYIVTSAEPRSYECHSCAPAIGVAVFVAGSKGWVVQSKNETTGFFGSFGKPGDVSLVAVGLQRYGVMLTANFGSHGYYESTETLLLPLSTTVTRAFSLKVRDDDMGDDESPEGKVSPRPRYVSSSAMRFSYSQKTADSYYDLSVVSHRTSFRINARWMKQEYREDTYKFDGSKYVRVSQQQMAKVIHAGNK